MKPDRSAKVTRLLRSAMSDKGGLAADELLPFVYEELREIAERLMRREGSGQTIQPTELIHEAYLRLTDNAGGFEGRMHFQRVAARAMRNVLVDRARARLAQKRGGGRRPVTLDEDIVSLIDEAESLLFVNEGLEQLRSFDEQLADIVELRFFGGMTIDEIASSLGRSKRTIERGWRLARSWWIAEWAADAS